MLFHSECAGCGAPGPALCHPCRFRLLSTPRPYAGDVVAAFTYGELARTLVHALKYRNGRRLAPELARSLHGRLRAAGVVAGSVDVVTWAPTSSARRSSRGYDQAELVARALARLLGVPSRRLLYRTHGTPQTGLARAQRLVGPAYRARPRLHGRRVLVVDDVVTTGATLTAARDALLAAGVAQVRLAAVAAVTHERPVPAVRRVHGRATAHLQPVPQLRAS